MSQETKLQRKDVGILIQQAFADATSVQRSDRQQGAVQTNASTAEITDPVLSHDQPVRKAEIMKILQQPNGPETYVKTALKELNPDNTAQ